MLLERDAQRVLKDTYHLTALTVPRSIYTKSKYLEDTIWSWFDTNTTLNSKKFPLLKEFSFLRDVITCGKMTRFFNHIPSLEKIRFLNRSILRSGMFTKNDL